MAAGKIRFIGCQSLLIGRNRSYRVQTPMILLKQAAVVWLRFRKDIVSLVSALLTLPQLLKLFRAAAETKHRRGGSLLMQANIFVRKDRLCTPKKYWICTFKKKQCNRSSCVNTSAKLFGVKS